MVSGRGLWCQGEGYGVRERVMVSGRGLWCQGEGYGVGEREGKSSTSDAVATDTR